MPGPFGKGRLAIVGGTVIDGRGDRPIEDATVLIEDGRIARVEARGESGLDGFEILDARNRFLIPGLIDIHVHFADWMGELFLAHGVTSIKDMGNDVEWISRVSKDVAEGAMRGPRVFYVGNGLDSPPPAREHHVGLESAGEARAAVRCLKKAGASGIKVREKITPELLSAITDEAHGLGLKVTGHIRRMDARAAAAAGIDGLEHVTGFVQALTDLGREDEPAENEIRAFMAELELYSAMAPGPAGELAREMAGLGVALIPTMSNFWRMGSSRLEEFAVEDSRYSSDERLAYVPGEVRQLWATSFVYRMGDAGRMRIGYERVREILRRHGEAGGLILAGSDTFFSVPGLSLLRELIFLVDTGFSAMDAIRMGTSANAEFMGVGEELGVIGAGRVADVVVLEADPLADINNVKRVWRVIQGGRMVDVGYDPGYRIPNPKPAPARPLWLERQIRPAGAN